MNYVAMMPNNYYNNGFQPQFLNVRPVQKEIPTQETVTVLKFLSKALNTSLRNYQKNCYQTLQNIQKMNPQQQTTVNTPINSIKLGECVIIEENDKENLKNNMEAQKPLSSLENTPLNDKSVHGGQPSTDDENHLESKETSKDLNSKRKNKKNKKEEKADDYTVIVPEVDLIQTAYIINQSASTLELAQKKEELMMRRITDCKDFLKNKKEKRQIRMLNN